MSTNVRRRLAVLVLCVGQFMIVLDGTVVAVALPRIGQSLGFSQPELAWVVNAYLIAFAGLLLLAGRMGDLLGRKRMFITGLALFTLASLGCGLAPTRETLIAMRFAQGLGGAVGSAVILGILASEFPEPRPRARVIGFYTLVAAAGGSVGLLAGGLITQAIDWHWIFYINIPIGIAASVLAAEVLDESRARSPSEGSDVPGALLMTAALMLAVYTIVQASRDGWVSGQTLAATAATGGLAVAFVLREAHATNPLVPLQLLSGRELAGSNLVRGLLSCAVTGQFFIGVLYMERVLHYGAIAAGLAFVPLTMLLGPLALSLTPRLVARIGARATMLPGLFIVIAGLVALSRAPLHADYAADLLPGLLLLGIGQGVAFLPTVTVAMREATADDAGLRSGLVNLSQQMGGAIGVAVALSVASARSSALLARGLPVPSALLGGYHLAYAIMAMIVATATVAALALLRAPAKEPWSVDRESAGGGT